ncbi:hypothetical protein B0F90DRAFT_1653801, partial [Multifurca ochricompacta]
RYAALKTQFPSLGRRALLLLIADEFWSLDVRAWAALAPPALVSGNDRVLPWAADKDEYDLVDDAGLPGIILRTDYSPGSDDAWTGFCSVLHDAEHEFFLEDQMFTPASSGGDPNVDEDAGMVPALDPDADLDDDNDDDDGGEEESDKDEGEGEEEELTLFTLISDITAAERFNDISNLRALRLLFDVSVRAVPMQELGSTSTPTYLNQLTCLRGLQETYDTRGRTLWIFDKRSRADGCVRLVSEAGDVATGDSWRVRATHMAELQAGLAARALRIDFGGLDRWDYTERQRNMREADIGHAAILSGME